MNNTFECWRPLFWLNDWRQSTFVDWLSHLGTDRIAWLTDIVLLYKHEGELEHDIEEALWDLGVEVPKGVIRARRELSEYEMCYEDWGLPRHFGKKRRWDRWMAGGA
ncbi:hypothetical protein Tdes44962_MAKER07822 [Teratosphaeria destructans]|uniref:Uncharacterized protein n=1 Tax=Teratosphaeria destructans TaxID=418781 RepID=A0A9W7SYF7_9PEZI|nr:hypothetical protein Tdes44962_MAKER07822 [Teratosphaeria destructans]